MSRDLAVTKEATTGGLEGGLRPDLAALGVIVVFLLILFLPPLLTDGPLLQTDQPQWAAVAHLWHTEVVPSQAWIPGTITDRVGAGSVAGTVYSASHSLLYLLSFGFDPSMSVKVAMLISAGLLLFSFYGVARLHLAPSYAALATILLFAPYFDNFVSGMWYNYLGIGFGFVFWLFSEHYQSTRSRWSLGLAGLCFALAIYSHPVGAVLCGCVWLVYALKLAIRSSDHGVRTVIAYGALVPLAGMMAVPQIYALLSWGAVAGADAAVESAGLTPLPELARMSLVLRVWGALEEDSAVKMLLPLYILSVALLCGVGAVAAIRARKSGLLSVLAALLIVSVMLISRSYNLLPGGAFQGIRSGLDMQYSRFALLSQIYIVLLSVYGISYLSEHWRKRLAGKTAIVARGLVMAPLLAIAAQPLFKIYLLDTGQLSSLSQSLLAEDLDEFWAWTRQAVDSDSGRICFSNTYGELKFYDSANPEAYKTHVFALTTVYSGLKQIGGWADMGRFSLAHEAGSPLWRFQSSEEEVRHEIQLLNCQYVVAVNDRLRARMDESPSLHRVLEFKDFSVFESSFLSPRWAWNMRTGETASVTFYGADDVELLTDGSKGDSIFLSRAFDPQWEAQQDGTPVNIQNYEEFIVVELPKSGSQTVRLKFEPNREFPRRVALAGALLLACLPIAVPRRQTPPPRH